MARHTLKELIVRFQKQPPQLFCNKRCAILLKKRLWHRCFPVNFAKFLRTPFFTEHLQTTAPAFPGETSKTYPKSGIRDPELLVGPETRDPSCGWDPGPDAQDPKGATRDARSWTQLIVWTRDLKSGTLILHGTYDPRPRTLKEGSGTLTIGETQSKHLLSNLDRNNYDSKELNQVSYK